MRGGLATAAAPVAAAVFVFGTIFGGVATPIMGPGLTLASSALVFSGSVQFAMAAVLLAGATPIVALASPALLNVRNLVLGAVIRPRVTAGPGRRAGLAWFLTDEAVGLSLARRGPAEPVLLSVGIVLYVAWVGGTAVGILGASLEGLATLAEAVFPVLFIGLAALSVARRDHLVRAVAAAAVTVAVVLLWPGIRGLAPVIAVALVVLPGRVR